MIGPAAPADPAGDDAHEGGSCLDLRAVVEGLDDPLVVVDARLRVLYGNAALERALGGLPVSLGEEQVRPGLRVLREDGTLWPVPERPLHRALREGVAQSRQVMGLSVDGRTRWVQTSARPLRRPGESVPYAAVATYRDVTMRRLAVEALAESEAHFRLLAENSTDIIERYAADGTCLYSSPAMRDVLGWDPGEIAGTHPDDRVHPEDLAALREQARELLRTGSAQLARYRTRHRDGSWRWVETHARAVAGPDRRVAEVQTSTRDVTTRVEAERRMARLALTDALTGLANRAALVQHLEDLLGARRQVTLLFLDLDRFKVVNDSLGHSAGDELLRVVSGRLAGVCRDGDVVARLGGDEFVVVAAGLDADGAVALAARLQKALRTPVTVAGHELVMSASVGIVVGDDGTPDRPAEAETLLRDADVSMYRAKARGRSQAVLWSGERAESAVARLDVERDLRLGLERGQLEVHYQPQVELATGRIRAFEALVRWRHPSRGLLLPAAFLDVADDTGLVVELGAQVLAAAAAQVAAWRRLPGHGELGLSVNLSASELLQPHRADRTLAVAAEAHLPLDALTVEVLESVLLDPEGSVAAALAQHVEAGIRLALDDFGTGSSSLLHLRQVPVAVVKIDRAFVAGLCRSRPDEAIVRAVRSLTGDLGLACVAEGVETDDQRTWLVEQGVLLAQGFLLHRPLDAGAATALLTRSRG